MQIQFLKIYSGKIIVDNEEKILVEYKIISPPNQKYILKKGKFHCAWFILENNTLRGPLAINTELIINGKRIIKDEDYPNYDGLEIIDLVKHNDPILIMNISAFNYLYSSIEPTN